MKLRINRNVVPLLATIVVYVILYGVATYFYPHFNSVRNITTILKNNADLGIIAVGMTLVILSAGIDLSVGAMIAFSSTFVAAMIMQQNMPAWVAWALALAIGFAFGAAMGFLIHTFDMPPFLVTLGGMFFARGMAFVVNNLIITINNNPTYDWIQNTLNRSIRLTQDGVFLTVQVALFLIILLLGIYLTQFTRFGRTVYAIGGNEQSAILMGLPVARTKVLIYAFSGFCAALAGIVTTFNTNSGYPLRADGAELNAIASVVIGGTLLTGGRGYVIGTLFGVLIYGSIWTLIAFIGTLDSSYQPIFIGLLLLGFILLQKVLIAGRQA